MADTHQAQAEAGGFTSPLGDPTGNITRGFQASEEAQIPAGTSESPIIVNGNEVNTQGGE